MNSKTETAFALLDEIREMQSTVDYLQARMLRKQVAVAEIMNSIELDQDRMLAVEPSHVELEPPPEPVATLIPEVAAPPEAAPPEVAPRQDNRQSFPEGEKINACKLIRQAMRSLNGATFYYSELERAAMNICPHANRKDVRRATYPTVKNMMAEGKVVRVPGGFKLAAQPSP